jgi:uncharacterized protein (DUF1499 family)
MTKRVLKSALFGLSMSLAVSVWSAPPPLLDDALACPLTSNCVNSYASANLAPFQFQGSAAQGMALLTATLATFPEAKIVRSEGLALEAIFTTFLGFKDQVEFRIDESTQRIHFRSRSLVGLYDFGKNRSRMQAIKARFDKPD